ncbi:MAG: cellulase family glycosylhydrolase [Kiritimatiellae bacterium]|nr:cellulase family glycosylhydrolase [Kiritimatiellia bacterium]
MKVSFPAVVASLALAGIAPAVPLQELKWKLPECARLDGSTLVVDVAKDDKGRNEEKHAHCEAEVDLADALAATKAIALSVRVRAENVTQPDRTWNGVKVMLRYEADDDGRTCWPGARLPIGTFGWRTAEINVNELLPYGFPKDGKATLVLGLQGCTGHAEFDLASLDVSAVDIGIPQDTADYVVSYPAGEGPDDPGRKRWRGAMTPSGRDLTEKDVEDFRGWGGNLFRFQINRNWHKLDDNQDLEEYGRWVDSRLDNLEDVLRWCGERGMKVCIDLHAVPGGKWGERTGEPLEMNMFGDDRYAAAFVDTWRRIATRFRGNPALYGYDLVNEPTQTRRLEHNYWELQLEAARAVREIDPDTPIVFAANLASQAGAFRHLVPIPMDNVIYQVHVYLPGEFTHQGVHRNLRSTPERPIAWPGKSPRGDECWDEDWLRATLKPVRDFQLRHKCRIYVGEFSAAAWAPGAENYLRDCIDLFDEYGWDWSYHAFRESPVWDVEKVGPSIPEMVPAAEDTPRKKALLEGFAR